MRCLALNPSKSNELVSGSGDRSIRVWDVAMGKCLRTLSNQHEGTVMNLVFVPGTLELVSCSTDKTIKILNAVTYECVRTLSGNASYVLSLGLINMDLKNKD